MRILLFILVLAIALFRFTFILPAIAAETTTGAQIFNAHCSSCHIGGGNVLLSEKTLKKEALLTYLKDYEEKSIQAIIDQVTYGKNAMPAFKNKLTTEEILAVAAYVFEKAEKGW